MNTDNPDSRVTELIETLGLEPHPEGGYYREVFRSDHTVTPADNRGKRSALTTIYFLLPAGTVSKWHRVTSDEVWHLYEGGPLDLFEFDGESLAEYRLGSIADDQSPVRTIKAGNWQAARSVTSYTLAGCTVGPGFDFADFKMLADDPELVEVVRRKFPELTGLI